MKTAWKKQGDMRLAAINGKQFEVLRNDKSITTTGRTEWLVLVEGQWDMTFYTMHEAKAHAERVAVR